MLATVAGCTTQQTDRQVPAADRAADGGGIDNGRGLCIAGKQAEDTCAFAIGLLEDDKEQPVALLSRELIDYDTGGHPNWRVKDRLAVPRDNRNVHLEVGSCRLDGTPDQTVVAMVPGYDQSGPEWIRASDWAYRVQLPSGKFLRMAPARIDCANTAIDAD